MARCGEGERLSGGGERARPARDGGDLLPPLRPRRRPDRGRSQGQQAAAGPLVDPVTVLVASAGLAVLALGSPVVLIALVAAGIHALRGPRPALQALAVMVTVKYLNSSLYSFPPMTGVLAWLVLLVSAMRIVPKLNAGTLSVLGPLWAFVVIAGVLAPVNSGNPTVSLMKVASFGVGATAVVAAALVLRVGDAQRLRLWLPSLVLAVGLVSLLTIPFPAISQRVYLGSFQGILSHPQSFGTFLAPLVTLLASRLLLHRRQFSKLDGLALSVAGLLLLASATRTAALAVILGVTGAMFLGVLRNRTARREAMRAWMLGIGLAALALIAVLASSGLRGAVFEFVFKRDTTASLDEAFMSSRGVGIESQWRNFLEQPLIGHGFGIFPGGGFPTRVVTFMGLPISAPVEKGFLPTAVLEEVGVVGGAAFLVLVVAMVRRAMRTGDQPWTAVLLTCLFINLGEAVFFSVGGIGLVFWIWMGVAMRGTR